MSTVEHTATELAKKIAQSYPQHTILGELSGAVPVTERTHGKDKAAVLESHGRLITTLRDEPRPESKKQVGTLPLGIINFGQVSMGKIQANKMELGKLPWGKIDISGKKDIGGACAIPEATLVTVRNTVVCKSGHYAQPNDKVISRHGTLICPTCGGALKKPESWYKR